ncbi:hypothetical protein [Dehalococcoides mccartyi]|uniref:Uncharacterized protein n=1 Tax=Dehalococcoides mccartyi TaxID=61435 RepID=A0A142V9Z7_9CHLR|nr:hypothetical protein [Dehalococcoides mccartyi]AGG07959.1 hypothetical protein btf_872 [Dehalococcoides mccartyi BTF08]AMU86656.1 hypothetical protein Dm11a5_0830 [Dehalococcoides mccartyi]
MVTKAEWWSERQIRFTRGQIEWLLPLLPLLIEGKWPPEPSNWANNSEVCKRSRSRHASFEKPCQVAAEIESRLNACGSDGFIVKALYVWGEKPEIVANAFNQNEFIMWKRVDRVLKYVSGWKRKRNTFKNFVFHT